MGTFLYRLCIILLIPLLSGCWAAITFRNNRFYSIEKPTLYSQKAEMINTQSIANNLEVLKETWGKPNKIILKENSHEEWVYKLGLRWRGYYFVIFPIPALRFPLILFPVGCDEVSFIVKNGKVLIANVVVDEVNCTCGFAYMISVGKQFGCDYYCQNKCEDPIEVTQFNIQNHHRIFPLFEYIP